MFIADKLLAEVRRSVAGTKIATRQSELLKLAKLSHEDQRNIAALVASGRAGSIGEAQRLLSGKVEAVGDEAVLDRLVGAWTRAPAKVKARFLAHLRELGAL